MDKLLKSFIIESRENLETAGNCFLELEKTPGDEELLNDLFRSMHTIKGSSGLFDIPALTTVVHASEDILDTVRSGEIKLTSDHIDLFLETMDQVNSWLDNLESTEILGEGAESKSQTLTAALRALSGNSPVDESPGGDATTGDETTTGTDEKSTFMEAPEWIEQIPDDDRLALFKDRTDEDRSIMAIEYIPDGKCFFAGDDPLHTIRSMPGIVCFHIEHRTPWPNPEDMDPYHCNMVFYAVATGDETAIRHYMRYVTEETIFTNLTRFQLVIPTGTAVDNKPYKKFINAAAKSVANKKWNKLHKLIVPLLKLDAPGALQTSALRWIDTLTQDKLPNESLISALLDTIAGGGFKQQGMLLNATTFNYSHEAAGRTGSGKSKESNASAGPILNEAQLKAANHILMTQKRILSMPCEEEMLSGRIASVSTVVTNVLHTAGIQTEGLQQAVDTARSQGSVDALLRWLSDLKLDPQESDMTALKPLSGVAATLSEKDTDERRKSERRGGERRQGDTSLSSKTPTTQNKILKIEQQRIDALMDLVGELVVAKNALPFLAKRAEDDFGIRPLAKEIKAQYAVINRLSEELQSAMMQIRMVPVSNVFQRFPRLVRDLSRKLNKKIHLTLEGEETEADKNVVDNLADPLIHLVRNSLDHGLETEQERVAAGKSAEGTIILRAIPHDDQVVIEVVDDGRGIDSDVIKRKAYEKGIIDEHRLDTISDSEALQLILTAGFSTAEEVSDLSGRGVGMDVVRTAVGQAGGSVMVNSVKGSGSTVRLSLPLSMAVSRVLMVEVASQCYGISMEHIIETVSIPMDSIHQIKHDNAMVLRDRLIPIFHLRRLLALEPAAETLENMAIVVIKLGGQELGIVIDTFHEGIDIIQKPMEGVMADNPHYSGAALLGDGRVLLVLNIKELVACR